MSEWNFHTYGMMSSGSTPVPTGGGGMGGGVGAYDVMNNNSVMYPVDTRTHILNIDSRFRTDGSTSMTTNFTMRLDQPYKNVISLSVASVEIPNSYYTFSAAKGNLRFYLNSSADGSGVYTVDISAGNYIAGDIVTVIQNRLNTINNGTTRRYQIAFNSINGKVTILNLGGNFTLNFNDVFVNRANDFGLGYNLGYRKKLYTGKASYTSESILDVVGENYMYLALDDYKNVEQPYEDGNILTAFAKIVIQQGKYTVVFDSNQNLMSKKIGYPQPVNLSVFRVRLIDSYGETIDLNGMNWSVAFEIVEVLNVRLYQQYRTHLLNGYTNY
jgi:hypothetical protein